VDGVLTSLFAQSPGTEVGVGDFLLRLLVAWLAGQAIGWFYSWSHGALSYSQNFVQAQALLSMVVCVIMSVVGDSLARAFGLGAALAIVRFRTPVKDARDTVFLFLSVAVGMASGTGMIGLALAATVVVGVTSMYLNWTAFGTRSGEEGVLRLHYQGNDSDRAAIGELLKRHCRSFQLSAARVARLGGPEELVYDVNLRDLGAGDQLVRDLVGMAGVTGVSLLPQARVGES
jgi:uncharacterized membrane protein YhiD involved in acid resistance